MLLLSANEPRVVVMSREGDALSLEAKTALTANPPPDVQVFDGTRDPLVSLQPSWTEGVDSLKALISAARKEAQTAPSPAARRLAYENALALIRLLPEDAFTFRSQSLIALSREYGRLLLQLDPQDSRIDELLVDLAFREELQPQDAVVSDARFLARYEQIRARLAKAKPVQVTLVTDAASVALSVDGREPRPYLGQPLSLLPGVHELVVKGSGLIRRVLLTSVPVRIPINQVVDAALRYSRSGFAVRDVLSRELGTFVAEETHASEVWLVESSATDAARVTVYDAKNRSVRSVNFATPASLDVPALRGALTAARASPPSAIRAANASAGTDPLSSPAPAAEVTMPTYKKWWVWVIVGGAVAAATAATVAIVLTRPPASEAPANVRVNFQ
jgi:hypothetical protein